MDQTRDALTRITSAARQWSTDPALTRGQQAMARTLERQSALLAAAATRSAEQLEAVQLLCCHLYAAVNGGVKPKPELCSLGLCDSRPESI